MAKSFYIFLIIACVVFQLASSYHVSFGNQIVKSSKLFAKPKHKVTIQHNGAETVLEVSEDTSILNAALDAGIELPYDCNLGVCLTCPSRIVSGKIDDTGSTLDDSVKEKGFALTCCSYPRSDVVIKSIEEDELVSAQFSR